MTFWTNGISFFLDVHYLSLLLVFVSTCAYKQHFLSYFPVITIYRCSFLLQNNTGQTGERELLVDINVEPSWIQGFTGSSIIVGVIDDGGCVCLAKCRSV